MCDVFVETPDLFSMETDGQGGATLMIFYEDKMHAVPYCRYGNKQFKGTVDEVSIAAQWHNDQVKMGHKV